MKRTLGNSNSKNVVAGTKDTVSIKKAGRIDQLLSILPFNLGVAKQVVAVLRIEGVIGRAGGMRQGLALSALNKLIEKTFKIESLQAVCLSVNSPGGSPVQSELIASRIIELAKEKDVPVYSFIEDVGASGGYWIACAGDKIFASRSSVIGSIGVVAGGFGFSKAIDKLGIERRIYTQGKNKSVLDPFLPEKEEDIKIIRKIQKDVHEHFISVVKERRAGKLTQSDDVLFNGEFWAGSTALDYGLIDGIENMHRFINKKFGNEVKIEYIEEKQSWFKKRLGLATSNKELIRDLAVSIIDATEEKIVQNRFNML